MNRIALSLVIWLANGCGLSAYGSDDIRFFETRIRPVLVKHCYECHSSASSEVKGELLVDFRDGLRKGGESGPAVVPGKPTKSLLLNALRHESFEMPPRGKLPDRVIADFETWIRRGAIDPRDNQPSPTEAAALAWKTRLAERSRWWSLQPPKSVSPPEVQEDAWSHEPVDRFVFSAMRQAELSPAKPATAEVLLRRLSFVLTGLPPTPDQAKAFPMAFAKDSEVAVATLVDELLESRHFGEQFARHWMDVVRYTDTYGYEWDNPAKGSWEYRDYLIRAFNGDVGFDQLIREQIAGDLLPQPRINEHAGVNESLIGPMFYHMGEHRHGNSLNFNGIHQEMINNKIDAFSKAFLAMTVACARCHDHKFDAVSQADYYALAGVFMSPRWTSRVIDALGRHDVEIAELRKLRDEIQKKLALRWQSSVSHRSNARTPDAVLSFDVLRKWAESQRDTWKNSKLDDLHYPLVRLLDATDDSVEQLWNALAHQWTTAREARLKSNLEKFTVLADFAKPTLPTGWITEGDGITHGYVEHGAPLVSLDGDRLIDELLPRGFHTNAISSKLPGAVRLPPQSAMKGRYVSLNLRGREWSGYLVAPQNAFQAESVKFFDPSWTAPQWVSIADNNLKNGVTRIFTEVATSSLNPNFPPRTGLARAGNDPLPAEDDGFDKRSSFSLTGVVSHEAAGTPANTLDAFAPLFEGETPTTVDEAWQRISSWYRASVHRWASKNTTAGDVELLNWLIKHRLLPNRSADAPDAAALVKEYRKVEARIAFPRTANSMDERGVAPLDYRLNVRGNVDEEGSAIPRNFLTVFAGKHQVAESQRSGRWELADYLSSQDNPQTARVYVNRVWYWIFGRGIVATPSDFGKLGERPSHPELLDWLATEFMTEGWSTKKLVRRLVLSQTFRQSSAVTPAAADRDPDNQLLHHYPMRRLNAEAIRDNLLAVSGRVDDRLYGRPINPPRPAEDSAKRLFSGPLDSNGRRSIYMKMSIMEPPKFLVTFNLPALKLPTGRRDVTNDPAQALAMLNHPLVVKLAEHWAERLVQDGCTSVEARIRAMFVQAYSRTPNDREVRRWTRAVISFSQTDDIMTDKMAWSEMAHAFFNTKEFIYIR